MLSLYDWSLKRAFVLIAILFILNWVGIEYHFYGIIWWWDILTHFLGGIFLGFALLAIGAKITFSNQDKLFYFLLFSALAMIIGWEIYEVVVNLIVPTYILDYYDTAHDIINGLAGWFVAILWYRKYFLANNGK